MWSHQRSSRLMLIVGLLVPLLVACGTASTSSSTSNNAPVSTSASVATNASAAPVAPATALAATAAPAAPTTASGSATGTKLRVVTTMSILADMITNVGGDRVEAENIIPVGAGPEEYQPTPQDAQKIAAADVLFYNGHGLEAWLDDLFTSAGKANMPRIEVSQGLQAVDVGSDDFAEGNPHFWMSAALGAKYVERIRAGLTQVDPAGEATYTQNAAAYSKELLTLNDELKQLAQTVPENQRKMVTNHDAFPYFAQEYGFTVVGSILGNPEAEPAAGDIADLVTQIKAENVKAIFSESQFSPKLTDTIAQEAGIEIVSNLYTDTLGDASSGVTNYVEMLRYNMKTVVDALK